MQGRLRYTPNVPMVLDNGGCLCTVDGKNAAYHTIEAYELEALESVLVQEGIEYVYFCSKNQRTIYFLCFTAESILQVKKEYAVRRSQITTDVALFVHQCRMNDACQIHIKVYPETTLVMPQLLNYSFSNHVWFYGIQRRGINKGIGVLKLKQLLGVPMEGLVLAADDYNDLPMFQLIDAPVKIAVSKKAPPLLELATHFVDTPDDIVPLLQELFLN